MPIYTITYEAKAVISADNRDDAEAALHEVVTDEVSEILDVDEQPDASQRDGRDEE